jgi:curved DNA-binding protein CbpA
MAPSVFDPYGVLGISPRATQQEILEAYRSMTREYHPDLFASDEHSWVRETAATKMEQVNEAWSVLGTPETRAEFDRLQARRNRY